MTKLSPALDPIFDTARDELEAVVEHFEQAWKEGKQPRIEEYLPTGRAICRQALIELVHSDLEFRLKGGGTVQVEAYLSRYPALVADFQAVAELLQAEFDLRSRRQPGPDIEEYRRRFPLLRFGPDQEASQLAVFPDSSAPTPLPVSLPTEAVRPREEPSRQPRVEAIPLLPDVAGYQVLEILGRGGMGVVYKARDLRLKRLMALKMIRPGASTGSVFQERFYREAELVARLHHPNIVEVFEVSESAGLPYLALEYVSGGSLDRHIAGAPQPAGKAAALVADLASAMHIAHQAGVVHRDLKPVNVLLTADGQPKITDFGLAKQLEGGSCQTHSGAIVGTPSYMAPEQAAGRARDVGPAADVYALGAILYELLTGRPPFRAETVLETIEQVRTQEPVAPSRLVPKVPRDLETICLKCLHKEAKNRYASARDLADDLRRFLGGEPVLARPMPRWRRVWKWAGRRPAAAGFVVASVVAGVSLVAGALLLAQFQHQRAALAERELRDHTAREVRRQEVAGLVLLAQQEMVAGRPREAQLRLSEALAKLSHPPGPEALEALLLRGLVHGELGEYQAAEADFRDALAGLKPGTAACYPVHVNRGLVRYRRSALGEAEADLREAIRLQPREIMAYANLAQVYQQQKRWEEAIAQLDRAIHLRPDLPMLFRTRVRLHLLRQAPSAALQDLDEAIRQDLPSRASALAEDYTEKGRILFRQQQPQDALDLTTAALAVLPNHAPAQLLRGEVYLESGKPTEALPCFDSGLKRGLRTQQVFFGRGQARVQLGDLVGAIDDFSRALDLQPDTATFMRRGWLYLFCEAPKIALADFQRALDMDPKNGEAYGGRGLTRVRLGRLHEATADANTASRFASNKAQVLYNAACIYAQAVGRTVSLIELEEHPPVDYCRDRALDLLRQATALVAPEQRRRYAKEFLRTDPDLKPIRATPGFTRLLAELEAMPY